MTWSFTGTVEQILKCCEGADIVDPLNAPHWDPGWKSALYCYALFTADEHRPRKSEYSIWARGLLEGAIKSVREDTPGPQAFAFLITTLNREFDSGDYTTALTCIQSFVVPAGTQLKTYLPKYEHLVTDTMQGDKRFLP